MTAEHPLQSFAAARRGQGGPIVNTERPGDPLMTAAPEVGELPVREGTDDVALELVGLSAEYQRVRRQSFARGDAVIDVAVPERACFSVCDQVVNEDLRVDAAS